MEPVGHSRPRALASRIFALLLIQVYIAEDLLVEAGGRGGGGRGGSSGGGRGGSGDRGGRGGGGSNKRYKGSGGVDFGDDDYDYYSGDGDVDRKCTVGRPLSRDIL